MPNQLKIPVCIFTLIMIGMFFVFLFHVPVRTGTPQIFRLRYYACQNGISGGPLSSSLGEFDWRKAFVWRASDTEYRQRQFSQFFEVFTPRIYAHLYYWFGPFMWLPLCLIMACLIGFLVALLVRQWTGNWLPGLVAGSFWLMTSEVLIGHHAPVRYVKDLVTIEMLGILSLLLAMKGKNRSRLWFLGIAVSILWWLGLFTDEYPLFILPAFVVAFFTWPWLRPVRWPLLLAFAALTGLGLILFIVYLPTFISPDLKEPLAGMTVRAMPSLGSKLISNIRYLLLNTRDVFTYTFGWSIPHSIVQSILAAITGCLMALLIIISRAWRGGGRMILFTLICLITAGGVLLPEGKDILHHVTYYNRPLVALMIVILGLFTWSIFKTGRNWLSWGWLGILIVIAGLNYYTAATGVRYDPDEAYLTRYGVNDILQVHDRLRSGDLKAPVFVSYPRFRDVVKGVYDELEYLPWHTTDDGAPPWSLYRAIMPRLYLRHFEEGELRANPKQFAHWKDTDEHEYRATSRSFYDMPAGVAWDLDSIRKVGYQLPEDFRWIADDGRYQKAQVVTDLLGKAQYSRLNAGSWCVTVPVYSPDDPHSLLFALRCEDKTSFIIRGALSPQHTKCSYGWSWQLFAVQLKTGIPESLLCLETGKEVEVIGPLVVRAQAVAFVPPSRRENMPPAGIPLLDLRSSR
jgi:hypothetical protein